LPVVAGLETEEPTLGVDATHLNCIYCGGIESDPAIVVFPRISSVDAEVEPGPAVAAWVFNATRTIPVRIGAGSSEPSTRDGCRYSKKPQRFHYATSPRHHSDLNSTRGYTKRPRLNVAISQLSTRNGLAP